MADKIMLPTEPSEALAYLERLARNPDALEYLERLARNPLSAKDGDRLVADIAQIKLLLKISEQLDGLGTALADLQVELEIQRD